MKDEAVQDLIRRLRERGKHSNMPCDRCAAADELERLLASEARNAELLREYLYVLQELRTRLHCAGRRPEECYEMSLIDDAIAAKEGGG